MPSLAAAMRGQRRRWGEEGGEKERLEFSS
jgi:hypothetical protein